MTKKGMTQHSTWGLRQMTFKSQETAVTAIQYPAMATISFTGSVRLLLAHNAISPDMAAMATGAAMDAMRQGVLYSYIKNPIFIIRLFIF